MPGFGEGSPFGQIQPTDLSAMLQAAFAAAPQAPGLDYMPIPNFNREVQKPIDLGEGGLPPGSARQNGLTSLGGALGQASQIVGSAMAANQAANVARGQDALKSVGVNSGGFKPEQNPLDSLQITNPLPSSATTPWVTKNPFGP